MSKSTFVTAVPLAWSDSSSPQALEALLAAIIRLDPEALAHPPRVAADALCTAAEQHGLVALVAEALDERLEWPQQWRTLVSQRAHDLAALDIVKESEFLALLDDLQAGGHQVLLMKGGQLAYSLYARPDLRPRIDSDLLVPLPALGRTRALLKKRGYSASLEQQEGDLLRHQITLVKVRGTTRHTVDLHWRVMEPHALAHVLDYDAAAKSAVAVPRLGPSVMGLGAAHALLLACVHRLAHHHGARPLIWLYDIHLLATSLDRAEWEQFLDETARWRVSALCARGLREATAAFSTRIPEHVTADHRLVVQASDASGQYLMSRRPAGMMIQDLQSLPGWRHRGRLLKQLLFPPPLYMRQAYAPGSRLPLALLYLMRTLKGVPKWLTRPPRE